MILALSYDSDSDDDPTLIVHDPPPLTPLTPLAPEPPDTTTPNHLPLPLPLLVRTDVSDHQLHKLVAPALLPILAPLDPEYRPCPWLANSNTDTPPVVGRLPDIIIIIASRALEARDTTGESVVTACERVPVDRGPLAEIAKPTPILPPPTDEPADSPAGVLSMIWVEEAVQT